jgi:hypothetical protein
MVDEVGIYTAQAMLILEDERVVTDIISYEVNESNIISAFIEDVETQEDYSLLTDMLSRLSTIELNENTRVSNEFDRLELQSNLEELLREVEEAEVDRKEHEVLREKTYLKMKDVLEESKDVVSNVIATNNTSSELINSMNLTHEKVLSTHQEVMSVKDRVEILENEVSQNEEARQKFFGNTKITIQQVEKSEDSRRLNENTRIANEEARQLKVGNYETRYEKLVTDTSKLKDDFEIFNTQANSNEAVRVEAETQRENRYTTFENDYNNIKNSINRQLQETNNVKTQLVGEVTSAKNTMTNTVDTEISKQTLKVDNKISEINTIKNQMVSNVTNATNEANRIIGIAQGVIDETNEAREDIIQDSQSSIKSITENANLSISNIKNSADKVISDVNSVKNNMVSSINNTLSAKVNEVNKAKSDMTNTISDKVKDIENRFNNLTSKQQQDSEVIDARDGETSLKKRLDRDIEKAKQIYVDVNNSYISSESSDGYLKNVEVIGNTIQDTNNLADIRSVGDIVEGQELYNISIQVDNGKGVSEVVEILSPVQLEKVGGVADRIICKDGVWGVEKNITTTYLTRDLSWELRKNSTNFTIFANKGVLNTGVANRVILCNTLNVNSGVNQDNISNYNEILVHKNPTYSDVLYIALNFTTIAEFKTWLDNNPTYIKYANNEPQFIPLPHDQQVKLRTFAGQTNIAFLTEIPGQIKAQVPKSLGATVNTHTEQIAELHNSLDRVKKLEETTVSTVETGSGFTTVDATSNGYFEDVKLEGKTLVNLMPNETFSTQTYKDSGWRHKYFKLTQPIKPSTVYTVIINVTSNSANVLDFSFGGKGNTFERNLVNVKGLGRYVVKATSMVNGQDYSRFFVQFNDIYDIGEFACQVLLLEGDHTNNPPEFFEGLMSVGQDVEEVSVESGLNMFTPENYLINTVGIGSVGESPIYNQDANYYCLNIPVEHNEVYVRTSGSWVRFIDKSGTIIFSDNVVGKYIVVPKDVDRMLLNVVKGDVPTFKLCKALNKKPLLYYNPTTETWEKPILREWDSIEKHSDGKYYYHKRSGEVVLNGSESGWVWHNADGNRTTIGMELRINSKFDEQNIKAIDIICDKLTCITADDSYGKDLVGVASRNNLIRLRLDPSVVGGNDVPSMKSWLQANPIKVVYILAQEEVYECTNIDLMTYSGETNYIINSGAISPKSLLKVHNNISNVVKILQEKVSLLENNVKTSQEIQDMMILESDIRILDMELALMEHMPIKLNLGENSMLRSLTYFNFLKNHIINETYSKDYLENVMNKYLDTNRLTKDEYDELYKMLYPQNYNIKLPIEY